jgi:hypothetical protein
MAQTDKHLIMMLKSSTKFSIQLDESNGVADVGAKIKRAQHHAYALCQM